MTTDLTKRAACVVDRLLGESHAVVGDINAAVAGLLRRGKIKLGRNNADGSQVFDLDFNDPRRAGYLVVHPADKPKTWDYAGMPWYVITWRLNRGLTGDASVEAVYDADDIEAFIDNRRRLASECTAN